MAQVMCLLGVKITTNPEIMQIAFEIERKGAFRLPRAMSCSLAKVAKVGELVKAVNLAFAPSVPLM